MFERVENINYRMKFAERNREGKCKDNLLSKLGDELIKQKNMIIERQAKKDK